MPKGIYPRTSEMMTGKYKRTEKHLKILKQQILKYAYKGPYCGFQKGHPPFRKTFIAWNKGLKTGKRPQWVIDKISKGKKGKPLYHLKQFQFKKGYIPWIKGKHLIPWNKGKKGLQESWIKGKHHSNLTKEKIKIKAIGRPCFWKGKKFSEKHIKNLINSRKGRISGKKGKHYPHLQGKNSPNWQGGISNKPYSFYFNDGLKEKIRKRDSYECQLCFISEEEHIIVFGEVLSIHHIDYNKTNQEENNLITLCRGCNARVNYNKEYWKEYFTQWKLKLSITK